MLEIKITGLDHLADAIFALAGAMSKQTAVQTGTSGAPQADPVEQTAPTLPAQQPVPQPDPEPAVAAAPQAPTPPVQPVPAAQTPPATPAVPTSQQTYTLDDLARAGMTLMDSGRQAELQGLLKQFGVEALPALPQEQYGAFATALRGLGAQI